MKSMVIVLLHTHTHTYIYADCKTKNVLYIIQCNGCNEQYVGETSVMLKDRMTLHRQHINKPEYRILGVSKHLKECGRGHFTVVPFYVLKNPDDDFRKTKELYFIKKFKPLLNTLHLVS